MLRTLVATYREAYGGLPRRVWLISLVLLVNRSGAMVLPFLSLYFSNELGFDEISAGILLACYGCGSIVGSLVGGALTQRIGAIATQRLSLTLSAPGFVILSLVRDFEWLALCLFLLSVVAESIRPASVTATVEFCEHPEQHAKALAANRLAVNLGLSVGPAIGGFLASYNFAWLFYANALSCLAACVCLLIGFRSQPGRIKQGLLERTTPTRSPWRDQSFLVFVLLSLLASIVFFQLMGTFPLYLKEFYRFDEYHIGLLFSVNTVIIVLFELVLVDFVKRKNLIRLVAWGHLLSCLGFGILPLAVGSSFLAGAMFCVFTVVIWTVGEMLSMPLSAAFVARRSDSSNRGSYMGIYVMSYSIAFVLGPIVGMSIYKINPHALWYASLVVGVVVYAALLRLPDSEHSAKVADEKGL